MNRRIAALFAAVMVAGASGATEVVSGDTASLLSAIESANPGETVLVPEGTYELTAQLEVTKGITLKASGAVEATVLKRVGTTTDTTANHEERVLFVDNADAVVEGFTVTGGRLCALTAADLMYGAGVLVGTDGGRVFSCVITDNGGGGFVTGVGAAAMSAAGVFSNCTVSANVERDSPSRNVHGAGVYLEGGRFTHGVIRDNQIKVGNAYNYGGGAYMKGGVICHSRIVDNYVQGTGYNSGNGGGGLAVMGGSENLIADCYIAGNGTLGAGGGVHTKAACKIVNCTIIDNTAKYCGGLAFAQTSDYKANSVFIYNSIISGNTVTDTDSKDGYPNFYRANNNVTVKLYNCLSPSSPTFATKTDCVPGTPVFEDGSEVGMPEATSPSINKGLNEALDGLDINTETDLVGNPRIVGDKVDIGCCEYQPPDFKASIVATAETMIPGSEWTLTAVVQTSEAGELTYAWSFDLGSTWTEASTDPVYKHVFDAAGDHTVMLRTFIGGTVKSDVEKTLYVAPEVITVAVSGGDFDDLSDGFAAARAGSTVRVGPGVWEVTNTLEIASKIGLESTDGAAVTEIRRTGVSSTTTDRAVERVIHLANQDAWVKGLTLSGGRSCGAGSSAVIPHGAGVLIEAGSLVACVVTNNTGYSIDGAGVAAFGSNSLVSNCVVRGNRALSADVSGVGMYLTDGSTVVDSEISGNHNNGGGNYNYGGGIYCGKCHIARCVITNNTNNGSQYGASGGGGIGILGAAVVENCLIAGNKTLNGYAGGIAVNVDAGVRAVILNCTVAGNSQDKEQSTHAAGAGGFRHLDGTSEVRNCIFMDNLYRGAECNCHGGMVFGSVDSVEGELDAKNGNLVGRVEFLSAGSFFPAPSAIGRRLGEVGSYGEYIGKGTTDLAGKKRLGVQNVDPGCFIYPPLGLTIMVR